MKRKLTLTVESRVTHRAKIHARKLGKSLSQLIEELLQSEIGEWGNLPSRPTFSGRWGGKFGLSEKTDERTVHLKEKYGLKERE